MGTAATPLRDNRTITGDVQSEATSVQLLGDGKAVLEGVIACIMSLGLQRTHKATCRGGACWTRHAHSLRVRLRGVPIGRLQCRSLSMMRTGMDSCPSLFR